MPGPRRSRCSSSSRGSPLLPLLLLLLPLLAAAFLQAPAPSLRRIQGLQGPATRVPAAAGTSSANAEQASRAPDSSSTNRQGFFKSLGITASAALLGPALLQQQQQQQQAPIIPAAQAIGGLPEFETDARFAQHLVVNVPDMEAAVDFYTKGLSFQVLRSRKVNGLNSTFVGYGPETLQPASLGGGFYPGVSSFNAYGAHFAIELNEVPRSPDGDFPLLDPGTAVAYLQLAVPNLRLSKLLEAGGQIRSAYGWVLVDSPNGLTHQIIVGRRRDPAMMLALNAPDVKKAAAFYKDVLGMREVEYPLSRAAESIYEPKQPKGSVYLAYNPDGFGILLLPYKPPKGLPKDSVRAGGVVDKLAIAADGVLAQVGESGRLGGPGGPAVKFAGPAPGIGTRVAVTQDPNGLGVVLVEYGDLEKELEGARVDWR